MLPFGVTIPATVPQGSEIPEGLMNNPVYVMGLSNNSICRKCGTEVETSVHTLCECETLVAPRHAHLGAFFLEPEDIRKLSTE